MISNQVRELLISLGDKVEIEESSYVISYTFSFEEYTILLDYYKRLERSEIDILKDGKVFKCRKSEDIVDKLQNYILEVNKNEVIR